MSHVLETGHEPLDTKSPTWFSTWLNTLWPELSCGSVRWRAEWGGGAGHKAQIRQGLCS